MFVGDQAARVGHSVVYLFNPKAPKGRLVVYHQGHNGDFVLGKAWFSHFLSRGYHVLALSMPLLGQNHKPTVDLGNAGPLLLQSHNQLALLDTDGFCGLRLFLEPVTRALNHALTTREFASVGMFGYSGGVDDTRLCRPGHPHKEELSGLGLPADARPLLAAQQADELRGFEQVHPEFYRIASYLDLYVMGTDGGRRQKAVYIKYDPCCNAGVNWKSFAPAVSEVAKGVGGSYSVFFDTTIQKHTISVALDTITRDLAAP